MRTFLLWLLALLFLAAPVQAFETTATSAWVYDVNTSTVLMSKNAEVPIPPASMSKLMTLYMVFEALEKGALTLDETVPVSTKAWKMGGSKMFVEPADTPTVEQLIKGIIVLSGNDACVVLAERLAGTEEAFAAQMTERAKALGLKHSVFKNSTGWPAEGHVMSAEDLGMLAMHIIQDFPQYYDDFSLREFRYMDRVPSNRFNRNPILKLDIGADGLKTGHTQEAGYGLVGSAVQDGRRVIFVVSGLQSETARAEESERLANWAFRQFSMETLVPAGDTVLEAPVWLGTQSRVGLTTRDGVRILVPAGARDRIQVEAVYDSPIPATDADRAGIRAGDPLGKLIVSLDGKVVSEQPLLAAEDVAAAGFAGRMKGAVMRLGHKAVEAAGL